MPRQPRDLVHRPGDHRPRPGGGRTRLTRPDRWPGGGSARRRPGRGRTPLRQPSPGDLSDTTEWDAAGHGSYGTIEDHGRFIQAWLNDGAAVLSQPSTAQVAMQNHIGAIQVPALMKSAVPALRVPQGWGLGFHLMMADLPGMRSQGTGDWAGVFNSYHWIDRTEGTDLRRQGEAVGQRPRHL